MSRWTRWGQLVLGIICLVMIANLQYGWTLFIDPIDAKYGWGRAPIQIAFTIFIVTETWVAPIAGYLVDRVGPSVPVLASGVLVASAWVINAFADSLKRLQGDLFSWADRHTPTRPKPAGRRSPPRAPR